AVLYSQGEDPVSGGAVHDGSYFADVPVAYVGHRVVDLLLLNSGYDRERYKSELKSHPLPLHTGRRIRVATDVPRIPRAAARNVVGIVPGADPRLRGEMIVVGGHMDHLGTDARGLVFNGADDNASGTAVVMELARAFAARPQGPARTLVFIAFAAEEQGLLGSEAFVEHPSIDLDRTVAMINFDMTGQGDGTVGIGGGEYYPEAWADFHRSLPPAVAESLVVGRAWGGGSDHLPFRRAGIPVANIWSEGDHRFYHSIEDDTNWIDPAVLTAVGRMAERWISALAEWDAPLRTRHRAGRSLLYAAEQVDFDGTSAEPLPAFVLGRVHWLDAGRFAGRVYLDTVARFEEAEAEGDSVALVDGVGKAANAAWRGRRAQMIGLHRGAATGPPERRTLLGDLHVALVRWSGRSPGSGDAELLKDLSEQGVAALVPADTAWAAALPAKGKAYVRVHARHGHEIADPAVFPRGQCLYVVTLDGPLPPADAARMIHHFGRDRVHLDLVPWIARGGEGAIPAFLEQLQAAGPFPNRHMRALLGGNLGDF
ncbi:MAG: M20/M25/M40 family metallo-hydrolase, partial [Candidatus Eisenbacteria bacterium]|nr:M20/M25/M40 family metallo-hydrolase [Candidatus Eisenbacteria bacterium]